MENILRGFSLTFFMLIAFISCEKVYDTKVDIKDRILVLNTTFAKDSSWQIKLSSTKSPFILNDIDIISDAQIVVQDENNVIINDFYFENQGKYYTSNHLVEKKNYKITVFHNDFKPISSESSIPPKVLVDSISFSTTNTSENEKVLKTNFQISTSFDGYLMIEHIVKKKVLSISNDTISYVDTIWIQDSGDDFEKILPEYAQNQELFLDYKFTTNKTFSFLSFDGFVKDDNLIEGISYFEFFSCSKEFFEYQKSIQLFQWNQEQNNSSVINPSSVYTNIENGLGIFAGYNKQIIINKFK